MDPLKPDAHFEKLKKSLIQCICNENINDMDTLIENVFSITQWNIKNLQIESSCPSNCIWYNKPSCDGHVLNDFIKNLNKYVAELREIEHNNLEQYFDVICFKKEKHLNIILFRQHIKGVSLNQISNTIGWTIDGIRFITKNILEALIFLDKSGKTHGYLNENNVFLEKSGKIILTDFDLIPRLTKLAEDTNDTITKDLPALGILLEKLTKTIPEDMKNFIDKCKLDETVSTFELLSHPFLTNTTNNSQIESQSRLKQDFELLNVLGEGAFGKVLKARKFLDCRIYAIKKICLAVDEKKSARMIREVKLLSKLEHENIVRYFNSWIENVDSVNQEKLSTKRIMYIQMEFCKNSTLRESIDNNIFEKTFMWDYFHNILDGLKYIHSQNVIHRDLKPANILIDSQNKIKIGDFGLATLITKILGSQDAYSSTDISKSFHGVGTRLYMAPELSNSDVSRSNYTVKVDMYALGIILFEMSNPPFKTPEERYNIIKLLRKHSPSLYTKVPNYKPEGKNYKLIKMLLKKNPNDRPTAAEMIKSELLKPK